MARTEALILSFDHHVLAAGGELPGAGFSSLAELKRAFAEKGLPLAGPVGVDPPRFAFLVEGRPEAPAGHRWVKLAHAARELAGTSYWDLYTRLMLGGYEPPSREIDVFHFGNTPFMAARLAHLVVKGRKRATSGDPVVQEQEGIEVPRPGLVSIVTDGFGAPLCAIRTTRVERWKFRDVPEEVARGEGEGDLSLGDWRESHWRYFTAGREPGAFTEDSEIFTEWFEVLRVFGA